MVQTEYLMVDKPFDKIEEAESHQHRSRQYPA